MSGSLVSRARTTALLGLIVLAGACGSGDKNTAASTTSSLAEATVTTAPPATATTAPAPKTYKYTKADNGKTVTVAPGDELIVDLEECAGSCGYQWRETTAPNASVLKSRSESTSQPPSGSGVVGGSGGHSFEYSAVGAGTTSFELGYFGRARAQPDESFTLTVKVA